jgi:carbon monoxide dehydrogenase subunit G
VRVERTITIRRGIEEVWAFVADPVNDPRWCPKVDSVEQLEGEGPRAGARYLVAHRPVPLRGPAELRVVLEEFDPPRRLRMREEDEDGIFTVEYELAAIAEGTRIRQIDEIEWKIPRPARALGWLSVKRDLKRQFRSLKRLLEAEAGEDQGG